MATNTNTKKTRKKVTRAAVRGNARPVITLTVGQAKNILAFAEKHGKSMKFLENKLANV